MKQGVIVVIIIALITIGAIYLSGNFLNTKLTPNNALSTEVNSNIVPNIPLTLTAGFVIHTFASNLENPRDLQYSPGGTLLVSSPNLGEVVALPDKNKDGFADSKKTVITGENRPHGLAFSPDGMLYVAEVNQVVRYFWDEANLTATKDKVLFSLPENANHNNRTITFDDFGKMYVSVGSTCNVCNEKSDLSAAVLISDADGGNLEVFAKGLRNAPFIQINPKTGELWGTEMGRDNLGDNLPPDEINIIREASEPRDYGWPNCYGNKIADTSFNPGAKCQNTQPPIYEIPAHSAPLGLTFINSNQFPDTWQGGLLVAYHGSWNRSTPIGYKVVYLNVNGNTITNSEDFITGFIPSSATEGSEALGRPVDLTFDKEGNLYLSDDRAGSVYIIQKR